MENTSPGLQNIFPSLGYLDSFTKTSPEGRDEGAAFPVHASPKKHYTSGGLMEIAGGVPVLSKGLLTRSQLIMRINLAVAWSQSEQ